MRIIPVVRTPSASYPTRDVLNANPELLRRLPNRWQGNVALAAAMAATSTLVALHGNVVRADDQLTPTAQVAPLFMHGAGRGAYARPATGPQGMISEEEARQVIVEEFKVAGLTLQPDALTIPDTYLPMTNYNNPVVAMKPGALLLDLADQTRKVAVEYVSFEDYYVWAGNSVGAGTVATIESKAAAQLLRAGLAAKAPAGSYGVIYDPLPSQAELVERAKQAEAENDLTYLAEPRRALANEDLRAQVKDFLSWLKTQGVI
jgi:hypothetical protein